MAKKSDDPVGFKYGLTIDMDELTGNKRVSVHDIKPGEEKTARNELLKVHDDILGRQRPAEPVTPSLMIKEAVELFLGDPEIDIKPRSLQRYSQVLNDLIKHFGPVKPFAATGERWSLPSGAFSRHYPVRIV